MKLNLFQKNKSFKTVFAIPITTDKLPIGYVCAT